jgi:hypothetical protein
METLQNLLGAVGKIALGATILEDRSLTIDSVQTVGDPAALESLGLNLMGNTPIDVDFVGKVPATASAFVHFKNLSGAFDNALANLTAIAEQQGQSGEEINAQIAQFESELLEATGINLREDILSWLTGNVILFNGYDVLEPGTPSILTGMFYPEVTPVQPIEQGLIIEVTDAAKAAALVPISAAINVPLAIVIAANEEVFIISTRASAESILTGGASITDDAAYQAAQALAVSNPVSWGYIGRSGFTLIGDTIAASGPVIGDVSPEIIAGLTGTPMPTQSPEDKLRQLEMRQQAIEQAQTMVRTIVTLFDSASVSSGMAGETAVISRLVLTLAE